MGLLALSFTHARDSLHSWLSATHRAPAGVNQALIEGPSSLQARQAVVVKSPLGQAANPQPSPHCCYRCFSVLMPLCCSGNCKALLYPPVPPSASQLASSVYTHCHSMPPPPPGRGHTLTVGTCYKNATKESLCSVLVAGL
jgi:hypothetical protein